jgi:hypothetical protein
MAKVPLTEQTRIDGLTRQRLQLEKQQKRNQELINQIEREKKQQPAPPPQPKKP